MTAMPFLVLVLSALVFGCSSAIVPSRGATSQASTADGVIAFDELLRSLLTNKERPPSDVARLHRLAQEHRPVFEHAIALMADAYRECRRHNGGPENALDWPTDHPQLWQLHLLIDLLQGQPVGIAKRIFDDLTNVPAERRDPPGAQRFYARFQGAFTNEITLVADHRGTIIEIFWED